MKNIPLKIALLSLVAAVGSVAQATSVDFEAFYIRNNDGSITPTWDAGLMITENAAGDGFSAQTPLAGQKVGYGTSAFDGMQANQLQSVNFNIDAGSVAGSYPYINLWVTDGVAGNYAILALGGDFRTADFSTGAQDWLLYEYNTVNNIDWLFSGGVNTLAGSGHSIRHDGSPINLSDLSSSVILADPGNPYPGYVGTGAPRGGFGFNMIFGDTAANYIGAMNVSDLEVGFGGTSYSASSVPDASSTLALLSFAFAGLVLARRKFFV